MSLSTDIDISDFYPSDLIIDSISNDTKSDEIIMYMHSNTTSYVCPKCNATIIKHHTSHQRKVQDLPILGKRTILILKIFDYECRDCKLCISESFNGFLNNSSRMTNRLEDFVCNVALNTSCEAASRILKSINIKISGDTVIRLLIRKYKELPEIKCGTVIGIDDFAFKKRNTYGTVIVDEETHNPVALLDGRNGDSLKDWLRQNKHITTVTRDRANAYSKAIDEIIPDAMQIADRFHLHQNLMDAINVILRREIPATVKTEITTKENKDSIHHQINGVKKETT